jgi:hypothetical protein
MERIETSFSENSHSSSVSLEGSFQQLLLRTSQLQKNERDSSIRRESKLKEVAEGEI